MRSPSAGAIVKSRMAGTACVRRTGLRLFVYAADFNGDGRLDLLLGDANIARLEREPLVILDHRRANSLVDAAAEVGGAGDEVGIALGQ